MLGKKLARRTSPRIAHTPPISPRIALRICIMTTITSIHAPFAPLLQSQSSASSSPSEPLTPAHLPAIESLLHSLLVGEDAVMRKAAENTLAQIENRQGWRILLIQIALDPTTSSHLPDPLRCLSLSLLKKRLELMFRRSRLPPQPADVVEKNQIKQLLLNFLSSPAPTSTTLCNMYAACISLVARSDWPEHFPHLFPTILMALSKGQNQMHQRTLITLHEILKELSASKLTIARARFQALADTLTAVRTAWMQLCGGLVGRIESLLATGSAAAFTSNICAELKHTAQLTLLALKSLRRLLLHAVEDVSTSNETQVFFPFIREQMGKLINILPRLCTNQAPLVSNQHAEQSSLEFYEPLYKCSTLMMRITTHMLEQHDIGFRNFFLPFVDFSIQVLRTHAATAPQCYLSAQEAGVSDANVAASMGTFPAVNPLESMAIECLYYLRKVIRIYAPKIDLLDAATAAASSSSSSSSSSHHSELIVSGVGIVRSIAGGAGAQVHWAQIHSNMKSVFTPPLLNALLQLLLNDYLILRRSDLLLWATNPEQFYNDERSGCGVGASSADDEDTLGELALVCTNQRNESSSMLSESSLRSMADGLLRDLLEKYPDILTPFLLNFLLELLQACPVGHLPAQAQGQGQPNKLLLKEAIYSMLGFSYLTAPRLLRMNYQMTFERFFHEILLKEIMTGTPTIVTMLSSEQQQQQQQQAANGNGNGNGNGNSTVTAMPTNLFYQKAMPTITKNATAIPQLKLIRRRAIWLVGEWAEEITNHLHADYHESNSTQVNNTIQAPQDPSSAAAGFSSSSPSSSSSSIDDFRSLILSCCVSLLHESDLVVQLTAMDTIYKVVDHVAPSFDGDGLGLGCESNEEDCIDLTYSTPTGRYSPGFDNLLNHFCQFLPAIFQLLFQLIRHERKIEELATKQHIILFISKMISLMRLRLLNQPPGSACLNILLSELPHVWNECIKNRQSLLRAAILNVVTQLVVGLEHASSALHEPLVFPLLSHLLDPSRFTNNNNNTSSSSAAGEESGGSLFNEQALELWHHTLKNAVVYTPQLADLFQRLLIYMRTHTSNFRACLEIIESYVLLGREEFLRQYATAVAEMFESVLAQANKGKQASMLRNNPTANSSSSIKDLFSPLGSVVGNGIAVTRTPSSTSFEGVGDFITDQTLVLLMPALETMTQLYPQQVPLVFQSSFFYMIHTCLEAYQYYLTEQNLAATAAATGTEQEQLLQNLPTPNDQVLAAYFTVIGRLCFQNIDGFYSLLAAFCAANNNANGASSSSASASAAAATTTNNALQPQQLMAHLLWIQAQKLDSITSTWKKKVVVLGMIQSILCGDPIILSQIKFIAAVVRRMEMELIESEKLNMISSPSLSLRRDWSLASSVAESQRLEAHRIQLFLLRDDPSNPCRSVRICFLENLQKLAVKINNPALMQQLIGSIEPRVWKQIESGMGQGQGQGAGGGGEPT